MTDLSICLQALNFAFSEVEQDLLRETSSLKAELWDLRREVSTLQSTNSELVEQSRVLDQENARLTTTSNELREQESLLRFDLHLAQQSHEEADRVMQLQIQKLAEIDRANVDRMRSMHADVEKREQFYQSQIDVAAVETRELHQKIDRLVEQHVSERAGFEREIRRWEEDIAELERLSKEWKADAQVQEQRSRSLAQKLREERRSLLELIPAVEAGLIKICRTPDDQLLAIDILRRIFSEVLDQSSSGKATGSDPDDDVL